MSPSPRAQLQHLALHEKPGGSLGVDEAFTSNWAPGVGAEIIGKRPSDAANAIAFLCSDCPAGPMSFGPATGLPY